MGWFNRFLRARRRDDRVKLAVIFGIIGMAFLIMSVVDGINIYKAINQPVDYIVSSASAGWEKNIRNLEAIDGVVMAGRIRRGSVDIFTGKNTVSYDCIQVEKTYAETVYGVDKDSTGQTLYFSSAAYNRLKRANIKREVTSVNYSLGEKRQTASVGMAHTSDSKEELVIIINNGKFTNDDTEAAVRFDGFDITGNVVKKMEKKGFIIEDTEKEYKREMELQKNILCTKYHVIIGVLCMAFVGILVWISMKC